MARPAANEANGFVTRADFRTFGLDHRRWLAREFSWLQPSDNGWVKGSHFPNFAAQHPIVFEQVKADLAKQAMQMKMGKPLKQAGLLI